MGKFKVEVTLQNLNLWTDPLILHHYFNTHSKLFFFTANFTRYPELIQRVVYTTNLIERAIKEIRKRIKVIGALPSVNSVEKFVYLRIVMLNDRWSNRVVTGFLEAKEEVKDMFFRRYS